MTLPPERIGYRGQPYEVRAYGWPDENRWSAIGWTGTLESAREMAKVIGTAPGCTKTRIVCQHSPLFQLLRDYFALGSAVPLAADMDFVRDLGADSLDMVTLTMTMEERFNIAISDDQAAAIETIGQCADLIDHLTGKYG